ncbi:MAG: type I glutamate--ammonia ligase [Nitrosopumilus sp.]
MSAKNILSQIKKLDVKWIRLQFCNPFGLLHQLSVPAEEITPESFVNGFPLDGSSILGFTEIDKSDILLVPDSTTFAILPDYFDTNTEDGQNYSSKAARMFANVCNGFGRGRFSRDSRYIAQKADQYTKKNGFTKSYWAAELEFFIFDKIQSNIQNYVRKNNKPNSIQIISKEAPWISQNTENVIHLKRGYYRDSPSDTLTNFRDESCDILQEFGIKVIAHHHEVATAGQSEIVLSYQNLLKMADSFVTGVKTIREVASRRGVVASFNPKPLSNDNGSAVHINQSLWKTKSKKDYNVFYDPSDKYAELSQTAHYYIGGLLDHAKALCAITNPTSQSYRRLVPGFEAPTNIAWGRMNRSVSVRIPAHHKKRPENKRIEYRPPDPTSNIYLVETAILLAGLDGIKRKIQPTDPVDVDTYKLSEREMKKLSIKKLPTSLKEAVNAFNSDKEFLKPVIDNDFLEMYGHHLT